METTNASPQTEPQDATPTTGGGLRTLYARVSPALLKRVKVQAAKSDEAMQNFVKRAVEELLEREEGQQ